MSRYIDADALIADLEHDIAIDADILDYGIIEEAEREWTQFDKDCKQNAIDLLINAPSIDIVRCKECKHYTEAKGCLLEDNSIRKSDDFCSYGEREGE